MSLPDGAFPRVNASMIRSGEYVNCIASVVGMPVSFDGDSIVEFECVDGGRIQVLVSPDFEFVPGKVMEIMGAVQEDGSVQHFISRELGEGFDFANYSQLISKVLTNPKYSELFGLTS